MSTFINSLLKGRITRWSILAVVLAVAGLSVAWNGQAYDFDTINTPTRRITLDDGREYRIVDQAPIDTHVPHVSAVRWHRQRPYPPKAGPGALEVRRSECTHPLMGTRRVTSLGTMITRQVGLFQQPVRTQRLARAGKEGWP